MVLRDRPVVVLLLAIFAGGCGGKQYCDSTAPPPLKCQLDAADLRRVLEAAPATHAEQPIDILVLSGGGSNGAWGAGVISGWRQNTKAPRPEFRVVTGVSTGSLQATHAFLGTPADDVELKKAYTTVTTSDIYRSKFILTAVLFSDSLMDSSPLKRKISKYVTDPILDRVAAEGEKGRRLYIGTTNLATGRLTIWDMTCVAAMPRGPKRLELYRNIVYASASIPVITPPVKINGELHVDGGVRAQLFFESGLIPILNVARKAARVRAMRLSAPTTAPAGTAPATRAARPIQPPRQKLRVYVIVNGTLGAKGACFNDNVKDVALRSVSLVLDAAGIGDLFRVKSSLAPGEFHLSFIPDHVVLKYGSDVFDIAQMTELFDTGSEWSKQNLWLNDIPDDLDLRQRL